MGGFWSSLIVPDIGTSNNQTILQIDQIVVTQLQPNVAVTRNLLRNTPQGWIKW